MNELGFLNRRGGFLFFIIFIHILTAREGGKWRGGMLEVGCVVL